MLSSIRGGGKVGKGKKKQGSRILFRFYLLLDCLELVKVCLEESGEFGRFR